MPGSPPGGGGTLGGGGGGGGGGSTHTTSGSGGTSSYLRGKGKSGKTGGPSVSVDRRGMRSSGIHGVNAPIPQKDYSFKSMVGKMRVNI